LKQGLIPPITDEWVRRLLRREGVSYQYTKNWKGSSEAALAQFSRVRLYRQ
jgi:transposase